MFGPGSIPWQCSLSLSSAGLEGKLVLPPKKNAPGSIVQRHSAQAAPVNEWNKSGAQVAVPRTCLRLLLTPFCVVVSHLPTHIFFSLYLMSATGAAGIKIIMKREREDIQRCVFYSGRWSRQVTSLDEKSKKGQSGGHSRAILMYMLPVFITDADDKEGKPKWRFSWSPNGAATLLLPVNLGGGWARRKKKKNIAGKQCTQPFSRVWWEDDPACTPHSQQKRGGSNTQHTRK